jgi:glycosyltransferase involved in cell wall biosynthesis
MPRVPSFTKNLFQHALGTGSRTIRRFTNKSDVTFIVEKNNWSIKMDGLQIQDALRDSKSGINFKLSAHPYLSNSKVYHFGSQYMWESWENKLFNKEKVALTFFHGKKIDGFLANRNIEYLIKNQYKLSKIIVSFSEMENRMTSWGIDPSKIVKIPIGVDLKQFKPVATEESRAKLQKQYNLPSGYKFLGSFQKDGEGWGQGSSPKLIKGPDLLVDALIKINKEVPIFVILSGPSRGYVINRLNELKIPYLHFYFKDFRKIAELYKLLDLYLVTSREEGGPKGLIESLASGCPVVTTPVGMSTDLKLDNKISFKMDDFEVEQIAKSAIKILEQQINSIQRKELRDLVSGLSWDDIAMLHFNKIYKPILESF